MFSEMSLQEVELVSGGTNTPTPACPPEKPVEHCGSQYGGRNDCSPLRGVIGLIFGVLSAGCFSVKSHGC